MSELIEKIEAEQLKSGLTPFNVGDTVKVHTRVVEGNKERIQVFAGVVLARSGRGINESFTVRRISYGEGVERVFPLNTPRIEKIEVTRRGKVRRSKLYYLRGRKGKEALFVKEAAAPLPSAGDSSKKRRRKKRKNKAAAPVAS